MRVLILTHGTRGDVQPYLALARALDAHGHEAVLAAPAASAPMAEPYGVRFHAVDDGPNTLIDDPGISQAIETNYRGLRGKKVALEVMRRTKPLMARVLADMMGAAAEGADLVVHAAGIPGHRIAEKYGMPSVPVGLQPVWVPTRSFPNPMLPVPMPRSLYRASYKSIQLMLRSANSYTDKLLGLPRRRHRFDALRQPDGSPSTVLYGFSRHVLPGPLDFPPTVHVTGFWYLPAAEAWTPPPALEDFLAAGPPPVYVGFGSMAGNQPERIGRIVTEAVRQAGVRAVLVKGWGGMRVEELPDEVMLLDQAPHDWLFPRMAAVVHHGGSGTTGAALAAGRPQVVCPFVADQPFWGARMHAAGVAPAPLPQRTLTPQNLADAIGTAVSDRAMAERADALGEQIRAENGVDTAVEILTKLG